MLRIPACLCYDLVPFDRLGPFLGSALCRVLMCVRAVSHSLLFAVRVQAAFEDTYSGG